MGDFVVAKKAFRAANRNNQESSVTLYVIPQSRTMKKVTIRLTPISANAKAETVRSTEVQTADVWKYYSVHLRIPAPGLWRLDVHSGHNHGCFEVNFSR